MDLKYTQSFEILSAKDSSFVDNISNECISMHCVNTDRATTLSDSETSAHNICREQIIYIALICDFVARIHIDLMARS